MNKKIYQSPVIEIHNMKPSVILCGSLTGNTLNFNEAEEVNDGYYAD